jgi:hypothetical protein
MASAACMKMDGVPVELRLATSFAPMMALFPIPVTMTLPFAFNIRSTHRTKSSLMLPDNADMASASSRIVCTAISLMDISFFFKAKFFKKIFLLTGVLYYICIRGFFKMGKTIGKTNVLK